MIAIRELVVVEGKTDVARLSAFYDADFYTTGGSAVNKQKTDEIKTLAGSRGVILFLDNDHAGELIRRRLQEALPGCKHAYIPHPWGKSGQVALANERTISQAMGAATAGNRGTPSISWNEYLAVSPSAEQRRKICSQLMFSQCNNKQFFKRINMIGLTRERLSSLCNAGF